MPSDKKTTDSPLSAFSEPVDNRKTGAQTATRGRPTRARAEEGANQRRAVDYGLSSDESSEAESLSLSGEGDYAFEIDSSPDEEVIEISSSSDNDEETGAKKASRKGRGTAKSQRSIRSANEGEAHSVASEMEDLGIEDVVDVDSSIEGLVDILHRLNQYIAKSSATDSHPFLDLVEGLDAAVVLLETSTEMKRAVSIPRVSELIEQIQKALHGLSKISGDEGARFIELLSRMEAMGERLNPYEVSEDELAVADQGLEEKIKDFCDDISTVVKTFLADVEELHAKIVNPQLPAESGVSPTQDTKSRDAESNYRGIPPRKDVWQLLKGNGKSRLCKTVADVVNTLKAQKKPVWIDELTNIPKTISQIDRHLLSHNLNVVNFLKSFETFISERNKAIEQKTDVYVWNAVALAFYRPPLISWAREHRSPLSYVDLTALCNIAGYLAVNKCDFEAMDVHGLCGKIVELIPTLTASTDLGGVLNVRDKLFPYGLQQELSKYYTKVAAEDSNGRVIRAMVLRIETYLISESISFKDYKEDPKAYREKIETWWKESILKDSNGNLPDKLNALLNKIEQFAPKFSDPSFPSPKAFNDWQRGDEDVEMDMDALSEEVTDVSEANVPEEMPTVHSNARSYRSKDPRIPVKKDALAAVREWIDSGTTINAAKLIGEKRELKNYVPIRRVMEKNKKKFNERLNLATFAAMEEQMWEEKDMPPLKYTNDHNRNKLYTIVNTTNRLLEFFFDIPVVNFVREEARDLSAGERENVITAAFDLARVLAKAGVHFDSSQGCQQRILQLLKDPQGARYRFLLNNLPILRKLLFPHPLDKHFLEVIKSVPEDQAGRSTMFTHAAIWATALEAVTESTWPGYKHDPFDYIRIVDAALPPQFRGNMYFHTTVNKINDWYTENIFSAAMRKGLTDRKKNWEATLSQKKMLEQNASFKTAKELKQAVDQKRLDKSQLEKALFELTKTSIKGQRKRLEFIEKIENFLNEKEQSLTDYSNDVMTLVQALNVTDPEQLTATRLLIKNGVVAGLLLPSVESRLDSFVFSSKTKKIIPFTYKSYPERYNPALEIYAATETVADLEKLYKEKNLRGDGLRVALCAVSLKLCGPHSQRGVRDIERVLIRDNTTLDSYEGKLLDLCREAKFDHRQDPCLGFRVLIRTGLKSGILPKSMEAELADLVFSKKEQRLVSKSSLEAKGSKARRANLSDESEAETPDISESEEDAMEIDQSDQGRPRPQRLSRATRHIIDAEHSEIEDSDEDIDMDDMSSHEREKIPQIKEEPMSDAERMDIDANSARRSKRKRGDGAQTISYKEISEADDDDVVMTRRKRLKPLPQSFNAGDITTIVKQEDDERLGHIGHMTEYLRGKDGVLELVSHIATTADYDKTNDVQFINRLEFKNAQGESTVIDVQCEYQGQDLVDVQNDMMHEALGKDYDDATITNIQRAKVDARIKELQQDQEEQFRQILDGKSPFAGEYDYRNVTKADITQGADPALLGNRSMKRLKQPAWVAEMKQIGADEKDVRDEKKIFSSEEAKVAYLAKLEERKFDVALKRIELVGPLQGTILSKAEVTAREEANSNKITEYLFDLDEGQALVASNLAGFAEVPWEFDPETGGAKYKDLPGYAVYRKPTVTVIHLDATKRGQLPTSTVLRWPQMLGFGVAKGVVHANCDDPYLDVLNRKVIPKLLIPYKKAFMPSWLEKYQKKTHDLWSKKADPHALRDRPFLEPMLDAQNRAHLGMDASVFYSIESLRQYMDKQPQGHELIAMVHVDGDHFAPMIVEKEKEGLNVQVLEPALQDRYLNALSKQLCKERGDLLTQFPINAQKLARGCISYGLQYLPYVVQHRAFFKKLRQIRRLGKEVPGRRDEVPEGPITKESIAHLKDAKRKKIQMITLEGQRNTSCLLQPAFFIGNGNETQLKQMVQQNEDLMGDVKWGEELRALQNEQAKAAGFNSYQDCVIKNREVRRDPASQKIETIAEANPLAEYGRLVLVGQAIDTIALMQQPREKHLLKEVAAIEDALAIESLESVEEKEAKQAALRTTRSEKQMRRVEDFLQEGNGLQAALEIRKAALPAELRGQSSQLVPGAMRYVVVKQELDQGAQTSIGKSSYRKATKGKHESWEDWLAAYQNKIRHGRLDPLFCNDLKQDHQAFVEGFVKYAKGKPLSPQKNPYELVKEMHHWIASDPKRKALNDKAPSPSVALSNFFREQYPQFLPLVHKGEVKRVIESSHQQEIDAMRQHYDNACADYNRERSLEKIPFEHYGKLAYRLLQQVIQSDTPFKEIKRKNLNLRVINGEVETLLKTDKTLTEESKEELKTVIRRVGEIMRDGGINSDRESLSHSPAPAQTTSRAKGRNAKI